MRKMHQTLPNTGSVKCIVIFFEWSKIFECQRTDSRSKTAIATYKNQA
jgi:hypothetical protein